MYGWIKQAAALGAAAVLTLTPGFAAAQSGPAAPPPPVFPSVDNNGVDLTSGQVVLSQAQTSAGDASGGLSRTFLGSGLRDNLAGGINQDSAGTVVSIGGQSILFFYNPTTGLFDNPSGGHTLVLDSVAHKYTYTAPDGAVAVFNIDMGADSPITANGGLITSLTRPNGEILTFTYTKFTSSCPSTGCYRMQAVTSNLGYMVKYEYAGAETASGSLRLTRVTALNLAQEYCSPTAAICAFTRAWNPYTFTGPSYSSGTQVATDSLNRATTYVMSADSTVTSVQRPGGATTSYTLGFTSNDPGYIGTRVTSVATPAGIWNYAWSALPDNNIQLIVTDPSSHTRTFKIDRTSSLVWKRVVSSTDELNRTTTYQIDAVSGRIVRVTLPEGNYTDYAYDTRGNITTVTQVAKPGSGLPNHVTSAAYDTACANPKICNKPTAITENGATTDFTYDLTHGGVLTVTGPAGPNGVRPQTRNTYTALYAWYLNSSGTLVQAPTPVYKLTGVSSCATITSCVGTADETRTTIAYGATGVANNLQVSAITNASGDGALSTVVAYTYNIFGDIRTIDGPLAGSADTVRNRYDTARQLVGRIEIDPDGTGGLPSRATRLNYNIDGQVSSVDRGTVASQSDTDWLAFAMFEQAVSTYDAVGRLKTEAVVTGATTQALTQYSYDGEGRPDCTAVRMNPAIFGSLPASACTAGATGGDGPDRIQKKIYSAANQVTKITSGYGTPGQHDDVTMTYRPNGQVETMADGNGNLTTYEYDGFDRLAKTRFPDAATGTASSTTDFVSKTYDPATWTVIQERRRDGQVAAYTYDARGNQLTASLPTGATFTYDNINRQRTAGAAGRTTTTAFDALGRITSVTNPLGTIGYQYNLAGAKTRLTWPDGFYVTYDVDYGGGVTAIRENGATTGPGVLATIANDNLGRRGTMTMGNGVTAGYGYDLASRLQTLTHNLSGTANDETLTFGYNPANQLASRTASNTVYAWPGLYNVSRTYGLNRLNQVVASGGQTLTYDARGNLTSDGVTGYGYDADNRLTSVSTGAAVSYDALDRLFQTTSSSGSITNYLYDDDELIAEYDGIGNVQRRYVHGPNIDEPLVWYEGSSTATRRWLAADQEGSIVAISKDTGESIATNTYDEYGIPGSGNQGRFQYTGQIWLPDLGVYYYKARMYSPALGRFLQPDPVEYADGLNLYAYAHNDPVNGVDPSGTMLQGGETLPINPIAIAEVVVTGIRSDLGQALSDWNGVRSVEGLRNSAQVSQNIGAPRYNVNLLLHEVVGGHTVREHVGKGAKQLQRQAVKKDRLYTSSFSSLAAAQKVVNAALSAAKYQDQIARVRAGKQSFDIIDVTNRSPVGYGVERTGDRTAFYSARIIIVPSALTPEGFLVLTAFPIRSPGGR